MAYICLQLRIKIAKRYLGRRVLSRDFGLLRTALLKILFSIFKTAFVGILALLVS